MIRTSSRRAPAGPAWASAGTLVLLLGLALRSPGEAAAGLAFPAPAGTQWSVVAGYNTATHIGGDPYAIDVVRDDAESSGTPVLAPVDGTLSVSTNCLTIRDAARVAILLCHVLAGPGLRSGVRVVQGQVIGVVAPAGQAGNNGLAHIHIAAHHSEGGRGFGNTIPLAGAYAVEGVQLPASGEANGYYGVTFRSTNVPVSAPPSATLPVVAPAPPAGTPTPPAASGGLLLSGFTPNERSLAVLTRETTTDDLLVTLRASVTRGGCTLSSLMFGSWVTYIDGAPATVNARWRSTYPSAIPAMTPLFAACG